MKFWTTTLCTFFLLGPQSHFSVVAGDVPDGQRWWSHVAVLADDRLEGRITGSQGHRKAAEYVAAEFARSGLEPAGTERLSSDRAVDLPGDRRRPLEPLAFETDRARAA